MRVAVTGAAGFIGSHLCEALLAGGHEVVGIDALTGVYPRELKLANLAALVEHPRVTFHHADVNGGAVAGLMRGSEVVCHLAGRAGARFDDEKALFLANVHTTRTVVDAAACAGVGRVVLAGSSSVYQPARQRLREDHHLAPVSRYGQSKLLAEQIARQRADALGIDLVIVRYFSVYGPRQRPDMAFARFIGAARRREPMPLFGDGRQRRDFTFVDDAVRGTIAALHRAEGGTTYNLAGGRSVSVNDALAILGRLIDVAPAAVLSRRPAAVEPRTTTADLARARRDLGYQPTVSLADGLALQVAAHRGP